eukprot:325141-Alexandrium_andersonii.AAC.1
MGVLPAGAFDVRPGPGGASWDVTRPDHREDAIRVIAARGPYLLAGSPPCTDWCSLNERAREPPPDGARRGGASAPGGARPPERCGPVARGAACPRRSSCASSRRQQP